MNEPGSLQSDLFTLRIRRESRHGEGASWRGEIRHLLSGETIHFQDWEKLLAFVEEIVAGGESDAAGTSAPQ